MFLTQGNTGANVKNCQYTLHMLTYNVNGIDGSYGPGMTTAVRQYQQNNGLTVNGNIDTPTWNSLSIAIGAVKTALKNKGYYNGSSYGVGDIALYYAVQSFQRGNGLSVDGMVGPATRMKLFAQGSGNNVVDDGSYPLVQGATGDAVLYLQYGLHVLACAPGALDGSFGPAVNTAVRYFQQKYGLVVDGSVGPSTWSKMKSLISEIQTKLYNLYDSTIVISIINGIAGPETYNAVCNYQKKKGLTVDGCVGPATRALLFGTSSVDTANDGLPLVVGSVGKNVEDFQYGLYICGINPNGFDGSFGPGMQTAVRTFQANNGLTVDGSVGQVTWDEMLKIITPIQQALHTKGLYTASVNGVPGPITFQAIKDFQAANGLTVDGMCGPATKAAMGISADISSTGTGTVSSVLVKGSNGSLTKYLQQMLNTVGGYRLSVDGSFGPAMDTAVRDFQSRHGLVADGSFGPASWKKIFDVYQIPSYVWSGYYGGQRISQIAKYELTLGFAEDNANDITPYGEWYGMNGQPWCAMFVSWSAAMAGYLNLWVPFYAYCPTGKNWFVQRGRYRSRDTGYIPKPGDIIFFYSGGTISHTGIVTSCVNGKVFTIEGNASRRVKAGCYDLSSAYIDGYGIIPDQTPDPEPEPDPNPAPDPVYCGGDDYKNIEHHTLEIQEDGYYKCSVCGYRIPAQELEDKDILNHDDFMRMQSLIAIYAAVCGDDNHTYLLYALKAAMAEIRNKYTGRYAYSDSDGICPIIPPEVPHTGNDNIKIYPNAPITITDANIWKYNGIYSTIVDLAYGFKLPDEFYIDVQDAVNELLNTGNYMPSLCLILETLCEKAGEKVFGLIIKCIEIGAAVQEAETQKEILVGDTLVNIKWDFSPLQRDAYVVYDANGQLKHIIFNY